MMNIDEATIAYHAARKLRRLYDAYRATSRASVMVLRRIAANRDGATRDTSEQLENQRLIRRAALSRETDIVFDIRIEQLDRRIHELEGFTAP